MEAEDLAGLLVGMRTDRDSTEVGRGEEKSEAEESMKTTRVDCQKRSRSEERPKTVSDTEVRFGSERFSQFRSVSFRFSILGHDQPEPSAPPLYPDLADQR